MNQTMSPFEPTDLNASVNSLEKTMESALSVMYKIDEFYFGAVPIVGGQSGATANTIANRLLQLSNLAANLNSKLLTFQQLSGMNQ